MQEDATQRPPQGDASQRPQADDAKLHGDKLAHAAAEAADAPDQAAGAPKADVLHKAEQELSELKDAYLRARAELENVRRQGALDVQKAHKFGIERFAEDLLPVKDALEQALAVDNATTEQLRDGVELTLRQLEAAFGRAQLTVIDPVGEKFDPHRHQAMQMVDADQPANTVVAVFQKGYALNDRVLRPALVSVAKG